MSSFCRWLAALTLILSQAWGVESAPRPVGSDYLPPALVAPTGGKPVRVIYLVPNNRTPTANYREKLEVLCAFVADAFKRDLAAKGLPATGPTFEFAGDGRLRVYLVNGSQPDTAYGGSGRSGNPWTTVNADVDAAVGSASSAFDLILVENWDPTTAASTAWLGDFALGASYGANGGRGMFSAWIMQDLLNATTIAGQISKLKDATLVANRRALGDGDGAAPSPVFEFIEDGIGAMVHELGHAFGAPHDHRFFDRDIMGNGFRNLRANYVAGVVGPLMVFNDENARLLSLSRAINASADLTDATDPGALVQAPLRMSPGSTSMPVLVHAWDDKALGACTVFADLDDSVIGGWALGGLRCERSGTLTLSTPFGSSASSIHTNVRDGSGRMITIDTAIAVGQGADFLCGSLGGTAPFTTVCDASRTATLGGTVSSYAWTFGDGGTATGVSPSHTWTAAGTYTVTLTVTYSGGATSVGTRQVRVVSAGTNTAPGITVPLDTTLLASASSGPLDVWVGDNQTAAASLVLTASSSNQSVVRSADLILGGSGSPRTITVLPSGIGTTSITLTVTDGGGLSASRSFTVRVIADPLPTGWRSEDIGDAWAGSASWSGGTFTIKGAGWGLNTSGTYGDGLRLTWQEISGDCTIIARVPSLSGGTSPSAGLQIRTSLAWGAPHLTVAVSPGASDWNWSKNRTATFGATNFAWGTQKGAPAWLRLVRSGNLVTGSVSSDGTTWSTPTGWSATLPASATVLVGLYVSSQDRTTVTTATFDSVSLSTGASKLVWVQQPSSLASNAVQTPAVQVSIANAAGTVQTAANGQVTLALGSNPGGGSLSGTLSAVAVNGIATFTDVRVSGSAVSGYTLVASASGVTTATSASFAIVGGNTAPTISDIAHQATNEDTALANIAFTVGDAETAAGSLTVSGSSSNTALVANGAIVFGGSGSSRTVSVTPTANQSGTATITVTVSDGTLTASDSFILTVNAVNDVPVANAQSVTVVEDTAKAITLTGSDVEGASLTYTITSGPSKGTVSGTAPNLTYTPSAHATGSDSIQFTVSDGVATSAVATVTITITAVNDAPTISAIPDQSTTAGIATAAIPFTIGDVETAAGSLTVTGSSSNTALVPNANIVFGGSGANRTVTITPAAAQTGSATITITVSDGALTAVDTLVLTVTSGTGLPAGWTMSDIGAVAAAGSASETGGVWTVKGSGADIWGTKDECAFARQSITGNVEITARVTSVQNTSAWAKAGVMIRESTAANSTHGLALVSSRNGVAFQRRVTTGGSSSHTAGASASAPYWVRLRRQGNTFTASQSADGITWQVIRSETITMGTTVLVGLAVTSRSDGTLCTATFDNVTVVPFSGG